MLYWYFWPEWSTDSNRVKYVIVSGITFLSAALSTVGMIYSITMAALIPIKPDVGIEQPEDSIKMV